MKRENMTSLCYYNFLYGVGNIEKIRSSEARYLLGRRGDSRTLMSSGQRELKNILTNAARPQRRELIAEADRVRAMSVGPLEDSVSILRWDRGSR